MSEETKVEQGTTHREFAQTNEQFQQACSLAGVQPTKRQAAKWRTGRGLAFQKRNTGK